MSCQFKRTLADRKIGLFDEHVDLLKPLIRIPNQNLFRVLVGEYPAQRRSEIEKVNW